MRELSFNQVHCNTATLRTKSRCLQNQLFFAGANASNRMKTLWFSRFRFWLGTWQLIGCFAMSLVNSYADLITLTHSGVGSGHIGDTPFTYSAFTITELADTANRVPFSAGFIIPDSSASISITGVGNFQFLVETRTFVNNTFSIVGFARGSNQGDLFNGPSNPAFASWNMLTSVGPITGTTTLMQWSLMPVLTDGGVLVFDDWNSLGSFQARIVPEPYPFAFLVGGLIAARAFTGRTTKNPKRPN